MSDIRVEATDAHEAEKRIDEFTGFSARYVWIDGDEVLVLIYGNGPTPHLNAVERAIDNMPDLYAMVLGRAAAKGPK